MYLDTARFNTILRLYRDGLCLQAYSQAQALGPLQNWSGPEGRVLAGRLAGVLGAPRLSAALHLRGHRECPGDPLAAYYSVRARLHRQGPWRALESWREIGELADTSEEIRGEWLSLRGYLHALFRDFQAADEAWRRSQSYGGDMTWRHVERSFVLQLQDRYDEALDLALQVLELRPWYRPAVQSASNSYQLLKRESDALRLLKSAAGKLEVGDLLLDLAGLQDELKLHAEARRNYERAMELLPLAEKGYIEGIAARRSDNSYLAGDEVAAVELARQAGNGFYQNVADRLAAATPAERRVLLPVGFVRQHHLTCAPATLTALCQFWNRPAEHLQVAETICYDGTPAYSERNWAERNGFHAREFTVDWPTAVALIDRGVPFTLTTVEVSSAHLQAVIGYDARRGTLLIRDPTLPRTTELLADKGLEHYQASGPRGMLLLPPEELHRLSGIHLPDAELCDMLYRLQAALAQHDRSTAAAAQEELREQAPEHRLTLHGERVLAGYDGDLAAQLVAVEKLLVLFPADDNLRRIRLDLLRRHGTRESRLALLREICTQPRSAPIFELQYAEELADDARTHDEARRRLRRLSRVAPFDPRCHHASANLLWNQRRFDEATDRYRVAACLDDKQEQYSRSYFTATRHVGQVAASLDWLADRVRRAGAKSSLPAQTLHGAYVALDRYDQAEQVLFEAMRVRPQDGGLLLFASEAYSQHGEFERAGELLSKAAGISHRGEWLRTSASLAAMQGNLSAAMEAWQLVRELDPQAVDAAGGVARLLAQTDGEESALDFLRGIVDRFPHNIPLLQLAVEWLQKEDSPEAERMLRHSLELNSADAWAHRELAGLLVGQQRYDEALISAEAARKLEPEFTYCYSTLGRVHELAGRAADALAAYLRAIELSADNTFAIAAALRCCETFAERRATLRTIYDQLAKQTTFGDGLLEYREQARGILDAAELLAQLQAGWIARPDLWHAWSVIVRQFAEMERYEEARKVAEVGTDRFPLIPAAWLDLANVRRALGDDSGEIAALEQARSINPNWSMPLRRLADVYLRQGDLAAYRDIARRAAERLPLDAVIFGYLADGLWRLKDSDGAFVALHRAIRLDPGYSWAWEMLRAWSVEIGRPELAVEAARDLVGRRSGEARSWILLARMLESKDALDERLSSLDKALALNPRSVEVPILRSNILAEVGRFDEAAAACQGDVWNGAPPYPLRGQLALIRASRGDIAGAIEEMREVLADSPDYYWGWEQLAQWCQELGSCDGEYLAAAEALVRLEPGEAVAWKHLADARLKHADAVGAKLAFRRSFDLAPEYQYPGARLFDLHLEAGELTAAEEILRRLKLHPDSFVLAREAQLAGKLGNRERALEALRSLARQPCESTWPLAMAVQVLCDNEWSTNAQFELWDARNDDRANVNVLAEWVEVGCGLMEFEKTAKGLGGIADDNEMWHAASARLLSRLGQVGIPHVVRTFVYTHRSLLLRNSSAWGSAGYALFCIAELKWVLEWLSDWRSRPDIAQWMLSNLADALWILGQEATMVEVRRHALTLPPDNTDSQHRASLALVEAMRGNWQEVTTLVAACNDPNLDVAFARYRDLACCTAGIAQACRSGDRKFTYRVAATELLQAISADPGWRRDLPLTRAYLRCLRRLCLEYQSPLGACWLWLRLSFNL